jgi:uncharacterized protein
VNPGTNLPILGQFDPLAPLITSAPVGRIASLLIKPASAVCNLDCSYCFYLDRAADPYAVTSGAARRMTEETLERLVDTWMFYSYPQSVFAFQGGEPTLAGVGYFRRLCEFEERFGRNGHSVSNSMQTNATLLNEEWCELFRRYNWLLGVSIDGPEPMHDLYRYNKSGHGTWRRVMDAIALLQKQGVEFNALVVVSQANVEKPKELYGFFRSLGIEHIQYIPLAEFDSSGRPLPFTITAAQYGRFLCETFDIWWPDRRKLHVRFFDNIAEALAGQKPGNCTMHESCDSYVVVEYNGDVYPCDFFVERAWKLGNVNVDSWTEIARRQTRASFAGKKSIGHPECAVCEWSSVCHGGCPKLRHGPNGRFEDLDYFCAAYKMIYARAVGPLKEEVNRILGRAR